MNITLTNDTTIEGKLKIKGDILSTGAAWDAQS